MLAKLDELVRQAQELQAHIKARMTTEARRDQRAPDWTTRRGTPQGRKR